MSELLARWDNCHACFLLMQMLTSLKSTIRGLAMSGSKRGRMSALSVFWTSCNGLNSFYPPRLIQYMWVRRIHGETQQEVHYIAVITLPYPKVGSLSRSFPGWMGAWIREEMVLITSLQY